MILSVLLLLPVVIADSNSTILKQETRMKIVGDDVIMTSLMKFSKNSTGFLTIELPDDVKNISARLDNATLNISSTKSLSIPTNTSIYTALSYTRTEMVEGSSFIGSITAPADIDALRVKLTLPDKATLMKTIDTDWGPTKSVLPKPKRVETDGTSMTLVWEFTDVKEGQDIAFYVNYQEPDSKGTGVWIMIISLLALAAAVLFTYIVLRRKNLKTAKESPAEQDKDINTHLKEDEQQIVNILRLKKGSCEQGTIRVATGFSKAKVSGLLKEMEERNIIHKEKRGNRNLVFLKA